MVSDSWRRNPLPPLHGQLFPIRSECLTCTFRASCCSATRGLFYMRHPTDMIVEPCYTSCGALAVTINRSRSPPRRVDLTTHRKMSGALLRSNVLQNCLIKAIWSFYRFMSLNYVFINMITLHSMYKYMYII